MNSEPRRISRKWTMLGAALATGTLLAACASPGSSGGGAGSGGGSILVGAEASITGVSAVFGAQSLAGVQTGIYAVNKAGGLWNGTKLRIDVADDLSDPVDATAPAHKLVYVDHVAFQDG